MRNFVVYICFILVLLTALTSCQKGQDRLDTIVVRIADDPDRLHPIIARSTVAYQIMNKVFQPLAEFDPKTLLLRPVLIDSIAETIEVDTGQYAGFFRVPLTLNSSAQWENGSPVTVEDVVFSLKCVLICEWYDSGIPGLLSNLIAIEQGDNDKSFYFIVKDNSIFSVNSLLLMTVLPRYFYDANDLLNEMDLNRGLNEGRASWLEDIPDLGTFAEQFNSTVFSREKIMGSGPYTFDKWLDGQLLSLKLKQNYWGNETKVPYLSSANSPGTLAYRIIPDEQSAVESLKEGSVDIVGDFSPDLYDQLVREGDEMITLYSPDVLQYYFMAINHRNDVLKYRTVRQALTHLLPIDDIISELFNGLASPISGPVHPAKPYYNHELEPYDYNPEIALQILTDEGWEDSDGNGILDMTTPDGELLELKIELTTSQRPLGQSLALILQDEAKAIGIEIIIDVVDNPTLLQKVTEYTFQMANLASRFNSGYDEVYSSWHSNSIDRGNNIIGFSHPEVDSLINLIHSADTSPDKLPALYKQFQRAVHREVPVIFICAPQERIAAKATINLPTTAIKPGYLEHLATPAK